MKQYEQKNRPTFKLPGGDDPKKNLISGIIMIIVLFILVILISKTSMIGGERLSEYRDKHPVETTQSTVEE